ncbi:hypothetical protein FDP41_000206 [Naegleria fowleri]|uniref:Protein kinase domain-containing protein n=1 Tax=Naegleria fowleri TaxID=5763 RepID=A0A6A5C789_NAEFO|nr:uncharacterized protein FDP41_000206 [Naegleria fowleri]KAF0985167.1 hypothetical protein FDP41_000206 [Naegleria fowleri]
MNHQNNNHPILELPSSSSSSSSLKSTSAAWSTPPTRSSSTSRNSFTQIKNRHSNFVVLVVCYEASPHPSSSHSHSTTTTTSSNRTRTAATLKSIIDDEEDDGNTTNTNMDHPHGPIIRRKWREFPLPLDEFKVRQWSGLPNDLSLFYYHVPTFKECVHNGINFMSYPNHVIIDTIELERHELKKTECYFVCTRDKYLIKPEHDPVYIRMRTQKQNESSMIRRFCIITESNEQEAQFYLEASNYELGEALKSYFMAQPMNHRVESNSSRKVSLETTFLSSAKLGQVEKLQALLTIPYAFSIDTVNNMGMNVLHLAALHSQLACLNLLLNYFNSAMDDDEEEGPVGSKYSNGTTPGGVSTTIHRSSTTPCTGGESPHHHRKISNSLLNQNDHLGNTPLFYAAMGDSVDCFDLLIQQDDISLFEKNNNSETILHAIAMGRGNKAIFESYFIACALKLDEDEERYKSWCNTKNNDQETAFLMACRKNRHSIVSTILDPNQCYVSIMDIHLKNRFSQNALIVAAKENAYQTCELLLKSNLFNVNEKDEKNLTPLFYACLFSHHECISLLLNYGADYTLDYQVNYLIRGVLQGDQKTIQYLLRAGMSPDYRGVTMYDETSVYHLNSSTDTTTIYGSPNNSSSGSETKVHSSPLLNMTPLQLCIYGSSSSGDIGGGIDGDSTDPSFEDDEDHDDMSSTNNNNTRHHRVRVHESSSPVMELIMRNISSHHDKSLSNSAHLIMSQIFQLLIDSGANVNLNIQHLQIRGGLQAHCLSFPLLDCVYALNMELFMKLLSHPNINANQSCIYTGRTCAHFIIEQYYLTDSQNLKLVAMFRELLKVPSFNVNAQDVFGRTPLYLSNLCGTHHLSKLLMNHPNCDATLCDVSGVSAQHVCDLIGSIYCNEMKAKKHKTMCFKLDSRSHSMVLLPKIQIGYYLQHEVLRFTFKNVIPMITMSTRNKSHNSTSMTTTMDNKNGTTTIMNQPYPHHHHMDHHHMSEFSKNNLIKFYQRFYHLKKYLPSAYMLNCNKFKNNPHRHDMFCKMIDFELESSNKIRLIVSSNVEYIETNSLKFFMDRRLTRGIQMKFGTALKLISSIYILHSCGIVHGNIRPITSRFKEPTKTCLVLDYAFPLLNRFKNDHENQQPQQLHSKNNNSKNQQPQQPHSKNDDDNHDDDDYYTSPEVKQYGYDALCEESDIYSLGAIFYELFFDHKYGEKDMSSSVNPLFKDLESILAACCSECIRDRPTMKNLYQVVKRCTNEVIQSQVLDDLMTQQLSTEVKLVERLIQTYAHPTLVPALTRTTLDFSMSGNSSGGHHNSTNNSTSYCSSSSSNNNTDQYHVWKATNNLKGCIKKLKEEYSKIVSNTTVNNALPPLSEVSNVLDEIEEYYTSTTSTTTTTGTTTTTSTAGTTTTGTNSFDCFEKLHSPSFLTTIYDILYLLVQTLPDKFKIAPFDVLRLILLDENAVQHLFKTVSGMKLLDELMNRMNQFVKLCTSSHGSSSSSSSSSTTTPPPVDTFSITVINSCLSHIMKTNHGCNYFVNFKPQHYCTLVNFLIQCFTFINSEEKCFYSASSVVFNMRFDIYRIGDQYGPILSQKLKDLCLKFQHPFFDRDVQAEKCSKQLLDAIVMCLDRIYLKHRQQQSSSSPPLSIITSDTIKYLAKALYTIMKMDNHAREYMTFKLSSSSSSSSSWSCSLLQPVIESGLYVAISNMIDPEPFLHDEEFYVENLKYKFLKPKK